MIDKAIRIKTWHGFISHINSLLICGATLVFASFMNTHGFNNTFCASFAIGAGAGTLMVHAGIRRYGLIMACCCVVAAIPFPGNTQPMASLSGFSIGFLPALILSAWRILILRSYSVVINTIIQDTTTIR